MNPNAITAPKGEKLPPSVIGGCFDARNNRMWLVFEDQTVQHYPKVPRTVLKKLSTFDSPAEAQEYLSTNVLGIIDSRPVAYTGYCIASALGMEPPTN